MSATLLRAFLWLFSLIPEKASLAFGRGLGWVVGSAFRYHRADACHTLVRTFPDWSQAERDACVRRMYGNLGMCLVESMRGIRLGKNHLAERVSFAPEDLQRFRDILGQGRGCLVVTAHLGNWEMLSAVCIHLNVMCSIITKEMKSSAVNEVLNGIRCRFGGQVFPRHNAYRPSLRALNQNEIVAFVLDQNMIDKEGVFVEFLGRPACTSPGLAHLSASSGVPVLPVFVIREKPGWYRLEVGEVIPAPADRTEAALREATQIYTSTIEEIVRRYPDQWILIHRRWRTRPPAEKTGAEKKVGGVN